MATFEELGVGKKICDAAAEMGWTEPTPVQVAAIPVGLSGRDMVVLAQTGTGKTGAYAMPMLCRTKRLSQSPTALVLAPTRELAVQIEAEAFKLAKYTRHTSIAIYGGARMEPQIRGLERGVDIVVGTPGRVKDMIERGHLDLSFVTELVLDEADRMLDMGFADELEFILGKTKARRTSLFSATMSGPVRAVADKYMTNPEDISIPSGQVGSGSTRQYCVPVSRPGKLERLERILGNGVPKAIVFCQTKRMVDDLAGSLPRGLRAEGIHGDMPQNKRDRVIKRFREGKANVLVATDVAARGLDVDMVDLVVNYDSPLDPETYVHRIGRTGRAGREGAAVSFMTKSEDRLLRAYEAAAGSRIERSRAEDLPSFGSGRPPAGDQEEEREAPARPVRERRRREDAAPRARERRDSGEARAARVPEAGAPGRAPVAEAPSQDAPIPRPRRQRPVPAEPAQGGLAAEKRPSPNGRRMLQINLGRGDGMGRAQITKLVADASGVDASEIGRIGLGDSASYFEVPERAADSIISAVGGREAGSKKIQIQTAPKKKSYAEAKRAASKADGGASGEGAPEKAGDA
ncbi:MAG: DEAD/DEAH box helicase [Candidatus Methanoplasma sp.]|jgi:ATP-dependent RNA helicase DeaD|nr:DEAD/DEAH box helicase [Candidatus Methanoplasma sp.]